MKWFNIIKRQRRRKPKKRMIPADIFSGEKIDEGLRVENLKERDDRDLSWSRPFVDLDKDREIPDHEKSLIDRRSVTPELGGTARINPLHFGRLRGKPKKNECVMCGKKMAPYMPRYKKNDLAGLDDENMVYCDKCAGQTGWDKFYEVRED
jgi:hypothetical protein